MNREELTREPVMRERVRRVPSAKTRGDVGWNALHAFSGQEAMHGRDDEMPRGLRRNSLPVEIAGGECNRAGTRLRGRRRRTARSDQLPLERQRGTQRLSYIIHKGPAVF